MNSFGRHQDSWRQSGMAEAGDASATAGFVPAPRRHRRQDHVAGRDRVEHVVLSLLLVLLTAGHSEGIDVAIAEDARGDGAGRVVLERLFLLEPAGESDVGHVAFLHHVAQPHDRSHVFQRVQLQLAGAIIVTAAKGDDVLETARAAPLPLKAVEPKKVRAYLPSVLSRSPSLSHFGGLGEAVGVAVLPDEDRGRPDRRGDAVELAIGAGVQSSACWRPFRHTTFAPWPTPSGLARRRCCRTC